MIKISDYLPHEPMGELVADRNKRERIAKSREYKRLYAGAKVSRLNSNWTTAATSANHEMRHSLRILRARARQMARDNSHFKKFLTMVRSNVVGPKGILLQCRARNADGSLNTNLNKRIEESFWEWTFKENCTASGKLDFLSAQNLFVTHLARDGEVLVQKVAADNPFGFALKFVDVSFLDENYNQELANGARIIMSVEVDRNDKPVAYYLTTPSGDHYPGQKRMTRVRVPAEEIIHAFLTFDDETQTRGVTWFHTALQDARHLQGYKEGVITSARAAASTFGMLIDTIGDEEEFDDEETMRGEVEVDVNPLSMNIVPKGYEFQQFDPKQPTQNHAAFYQSILADLAVGLDVNYFSLAGDMKAVNFSSARVGLGEERDIWKLIQAFVCTYFCREVYHAWLKSAWMNGKLELTSNEMKEAQNPNW